MPLRSSKGTKKPLAPQKRDSILEAALIEFSTKNFEAASTNAIAARAKVAKGLIFHHFSNKDTLYLALVDQALSSFSKDLFASVTNSAPDLFERLQEWISIRLRLIHKNPRPVLFLLSVFSRPPQHLQKQLQERAQKLSAIGMELFVKDLSFHSLRKNILPEQALQAVILLRDGLERKYIQQIASSPEITLEQIDQMVEESLFFLTLLRDGLYRKELSEETKE